MTPPAVTPATPEVGIHASRDQATRNAAPRTARMIIVTLAALLITIGLWAQMTVVDELARATGEIAPMGDLHRIQHLEGGIVRSIHVSTGDHVKRGDVLISLSSEALDFEIAEYEVRATSLGAELKRLRTLLSDLPIDPPTPKGPGLPGVAPQSDLTAALRETFLLRRAAQAAQIRSKAAALRAALEVRSSVAEQVALAEEGLAIVARLADKGQISRAELLRRRQDVVDLRGNLMRASASAEAARSEHQEATSSFEKLRLEAREKYLGELAEHKGEYDALSQNLAQLRERRERLELRAAADGVVQAVLVRAAGEVLEPGGVVAEVLPSGVALQAAIRVSPNDIGHIEAGDPVRVKLTAFNERKYGTLEGEVQTISATSISVPEREPYFEVAVRLHSDEIGTGRNIRPVQAGMVVNAEILTSDRTVAEFLLEPIRRSLGDSFHER